MDKPAITSAPRHTTHEQARDIRARAWSFAFDCFNRRKGQGGSQATAPEDAKVRSKHDSRADKAIIPE